jgi:hypothetical protein
VRFACTNNNYSVLSAALSGDLSPAATILVDAVEGLAEIAVAAVFPLGSLDGLPVSEAGPLYRSLKLIAKIRDEICPDLDADPSGEVSVFDFGILGVQFLYSLSEEVSADGFEFVTETGLPAFPTAASLWQAAIEALLSTYETADEEGDAGQGAPSQPHGRGGVSGQCACSPHSGSGTARFASTDSPRALDGVARAERGAVAARWNE